MRRIDEIIIHCSATRAGVKVHASDIDRWHRERGFDCIGYHYVITLAGKVELGRPEDRIGAHCKGHNAHSIGICYVGGLDENGKCCNTMNVAQRIRLVKLLKELIGMYPNATIHGHNEFSNKLCPCFDVTNFVTSHSSEIYF